MERWELDIFPRVLADRLLSTMKSLRSKAPPRVAVAVLSTAWNRWCTARRFQKRGTAANNCVLGCGGGAEDSIEHYARCRCVRKFHAQDLGIPGDYLLPIWLNVDGISRTDEQKVRAAIGAYAVYNTTNAARQEGGWADHVAIRALQQSAREGAMGHKFAETSLRMVWAHSRR